MSLTFDTSQQPVQGDPELRFVERDEFCQLLLSSRRLVRSDDRAANIRGLLDLEMGVRFLIKEDKLFHD